MFKFVLSLFGWFNAFVRSHGPPGPHFLALAADVLVILGYAIIACLVVNDAVKVAMIKWRVLKAVAKKPVDLTAQIAKRAYELYEQRGRQDGRAVQAWGQAEREIRKDKSHK